MMESNETTPSASQAPPPPIRKKSVFYVDGFNFYYGLLHERPELKWLNLQRLAELLRPDDDILKVRFFTALLDAKKERSEKRDRQKRIWRALFTQPKIEFTYGKFGRRERECQVVSCPKRQKYWTLEEKQTDVNISLAMVRDTTALNPDVVVLVSGDIDQVPALEEVSRLKPATRFVIYIPAHEANLTYRRKDEFTKFASVVKPIPEKYLRMAQFPDRVPDGKGGYIIRPDAWPAGPQPTTLNSQPAPPK